MEVGTHNRPMNEASQNTTVEHELARLEKCFNELLSRTAQLREENRALRQRQEALITERAALLQKNEQVRARVEAMVGRLKAMEHGT
jgi:cell division protein ZapB